MVEIHTLKKDGKTIYPQTHIQAVVDDNGNTVEELIAQTSENILSEVQAITEGLVTKEAHTSDINTLDGKISVKADKTYVDEVIRQSIINVINSDL